MSEKLPHIRLLLGYLLGWLVLSDNVGAQPAGSPTTAKQLEIGLPSFRNFSHKDNGAHMQNFAAVQDRRGLIYIANGGGVLEFDGQRWRLIEVANRTNVRSLAVDAEGRVYVGAVGEIGYLSADATGQNRYVSLLDQVPPEARDFTEVWETFATPNGVIFSSFQRMIRFRGEHFESWKPTTIFHRAFNVGGRVFAREPGRGLLELVDGDLRLLPGGERFAEEKIFAILPSESSPPVGPALLIGTQTQGFFRLDSGALVSWPTAVDSELRGKLPNCAVQLIGDRLAIGTIQDGLYVLDSAGRLLQHINKTGGIPDNLVHALFLDRERGLWLILNRGLSRVQIDSPLSYFDGRNGLEGLAYTVRRHQDRLYVGTSQGLYFLVPGANARFKAIAGVTGQIWAFAADGENLLFSNNQGVFQLQGEKAQLLAETNVSLSMLVSKVQPGNMFVGLLGGLARFRKVGNRWQFEGRVPGIDQSARTLFEEGDGTLWLGTENTGLLRVRFSPSGEPLQISRFGPNEGLPSTSENNVHPLHGEMRATTLAGIYRLNGDEHFEPDARFTGLFAAPRAMLRLLEAPAGVWLSAEYGTGLAARQMDGSYRWESRAFSELNGSTSLAFHGDASGVLWIAREDGLVRYDPSIVKEYAQPYSALLRQVTGPAGQVLYGGSGTPRALRLAYSEQAMRFTFAAPSFDGQDVNRFQVLLERNDSDWSAWSAEDYKDYSNLWEGDYRFRVRAKNLYGMQSAEATFNFTVLPPWHRTIAAYIAYVLILAGLIWGTLRWRTWHLWAQKRALESTVLERTQALNEANATLLRANLQRKQLLGFLGHDLRGPLAAIASAVDRSNPMLGDQRGLTDLIRLESRRALRLADQFSALVKAESDLTELELTDFARAADEAADEIFLTAQQRNVQVQRSLPENASVRADFRLLVRAIANLLDNAIQSAPRRSVVEMELSLADEELVLTIKNALDANQRPSQRPSLGLGLLLVRSAVQRFGGQFDLKITSTNAVATMRLPAAHSTEGSY